MGQVATVLYSELKRYLCLLDQNDSLYLQLFILVLENMSSCSRIRQHMLR